MHTVNISRYEIFTHGAPDDFEDILHSIEFRYTTGHLALSGLNEEQIVRAINRAMKVCRLNAVEISDHFRPVYVFDEKNHTTYSDWRMTRQGLALVVMNAPAINQAIANLQWELVTSVTH